MRSRWIYAAIALAVLVLAPVAVVHGVLRGSLPTLDGTVAASGLSSAVTIERDSLGVPTITATNRVDLAYATGWVHGQDRFFQMDLSRRLAAGELSELVGRAALAQDESARQIHLKETILAMDPSGRVGQIDSVRGGNRGYAEAIALDRHRSRESRGRDSSVERGQGSA